MLSREHEPTGYIYIYIILYIHLCTYIIIYIYDYMYIYNTKSENRIYPHSKMFFSICFSRELKLPGTSRPWQEDSKEAAMEFANRGMCRRHANCCGLSLTDVLFFFRKQI